MLTNFTLRPAAFRFAAVAAALLLAHAGQATIHEPQAKAASTTKPARPVAGHKPAAPAPAAAPAPSARPVEKPAEKPAAPQTVVLKGVVLKADGQPCPGAGVYMSGAPRQVVVTDAAGAFALPVPAGAPLTLHADYLGLGSSRVAIQNPTAQPLRITIGR